MYIYQIIVYNIWTLQSIQDACSTEQVIALLSSVDAVSC